jgi:hypothetical protein
MQLFTLLTLALAALTAAKTDIAGCTSTSDGASLIYYVPGTGEICSFLDCGGGRAAPKTDVPGCPLYSGTGTYSPSFLAMATATSDSISLTTITQITASTTDSAPATTTLLTSLAFETIEPTGILVDTGTPEIPVATTAFATFVSSTMTHSAEGSLATGVGSGSGVGGVGSNGTSLNNGGRPGTTGTAPISGGQRLRGMGVVAGVVVGFFVVLL